MSKLALFSVMILSMPALAKTAPVTVNAAKAAYATSLANSGATKPAFVKFSGPALAQFNKQVKRGGGSADTIVYRLGGRSAIAKNTAMIETDGEAISYFTIVKTNRKGASRVLATGYNGASGKLTWRK